MGRKRRRESPSFERLIAQTTSCSDPLFVSGPYGDFYLELESPYIDAGSESAEEAGLSDRTTQADGTPETGTVDMGFHYPMPSFLARWLEKKVAVLLKIGHIIYRCY